MKIKLFVPYFNEQMLAKLNIISSLKWVDEFHLTESNYTFQGVKKDFNFNFDDYSSFMDKIKYHPVDFKNTFLFNRTFFPHIGGKNRPLWHPKVFYNTSWYNEGVQRNKSCDKILIDDDDIIVLSDVDEIIDPKKFKLIIAAVEKHKIVTVKLHFSLLYFNLFSTNWSGPSDYSYRVFIMKGSEFRKRNYDYDTIRKLGERGKLSNEVFCLPEICGFHHSWIGNKNFIKEKLMAYAHVEHRDLNDDLYIENCLRDGKSLFDNHEVHVDNSIDLLEEIETNRTQYKDFFFE
jgi:hypothetical protein